jgi:hypothetical protein
MILRRNSIKKTRKSRVFRVEFRVSLLENSGFSSLSFKNSNLTRNSAFFEFHCMAMTYFFWTTIQGFRRGQSLKSLQYRRF